MQDDMVLPAFELDCRDWLVTTPESGIPDELDGAPVLAMLSTAVIAEDDLRSASGLITVGLVDLESPESVELLDGRPAAELIEPEAGPGRVRYLMASPVGPVALVAEFEVTNGPDAELSRRIDALMASFRWAA